MVDDRERERERERSGHEGPEEEQERERKWGRRDSLSSIPPRAREGESVNQKERGREGKLSSRHT